VSVVEHQLVRVLGEARDLLGAGFIETLLVEADVQAARQKGRVRFELLGIGAVGLADGVEEFLQALTIEAGLLQVLCGANEGSGLAANGGAKRAEGATGVRGEEYESFFGLVGNGDKDAFVADGVGPRLDSSEPGIWRRIRRTTQEGNDHQIADRLTLGKIGVNPQAVSGLQTGDLGNRESYTGALDTNLNLWAGEVEGCIFGVKIGGK